MSILDSIKGERKLSFNNWRYRLLHWTFNVKNPDPKETWRNGIPSFLYTHYCPLFHLTNLIALLSPLILFIKISVLLGRAFATCLDLVPWSTIFAFLQKFKPEKKTVTPNTNSYKGRERKEIIKHLRNWTLDFEVFWETHHFIWNIKAEVEEIFKEWMPKIIKAREEAEEQRKKWRDTIVFWTNFSGVFIKWGMNIGYIGLSLVFLYLTYLAVEPVWNCLCWAVEFLVWLFTDLGTLAFLWITAKIMFWAGLAFGFLFIMFKSGVLEKVITVLYDGFVFISPPFYVLLIPFKWIASGYKNTVEFVSMFYEENCPPITIISEEESIVESVAKNGEEV